MVEIIGAAVLLMSIAYLMRLTARLQRLKAEKQALNLVISELSAEG
jgi:hypothetical protein